MIKRYYPTHTDGPGAVMVEEHYGDWVSFGDYQDLLDKYETLQNRMSYVTELIVELYREA